MYRNRLSLFRLLRDSMRAVLAIIALLSLNQILLAQATAPINLMPMPAAIHLGSGQFGIDRSFSVAVSGQRDALVDKAVERFLAQLSRQTGMGFAAAPEKNNPVFSVKVEGKTRGVSQPGEDESYHLRITSSGGSLSAPGSLGILHGLQTLLQLVQTGANGFYIPAVTIDDQPRFPWRGLLIDVARHYIPVDVLKRNLDGMAAVKMNVLHLHLSDDQGFRVESKRYPRLSQMGSDGMYYTQSEIRDLIAYAADRGIRIMPEFDMPAHSLAWFVGYPELASTSGEYKIDPAAPYSIMDPTKERTYKFLDKFIAEMAKLFPDPYFHIGGDEVNGKPWDDNPAIQAFMHSHGIKSNQDLQAYFNQKLEKILRKNHKIMVGWDEILRPDLPKTILVQSWRGQASLATAAQQGYQGILSFGYYLDLMWPASQHYAVDPMSGPASALNPEQTSRILGGEACMWSEWISPENLDSRVWPRTGAIAERLWSPQTVQDVSSMYGRLEELSWRLEGVGLTHRSHETPMLHRMTGGDDIEALRTLASVLEPVKDYSRMQAVTGNWDFRAPLNHLVDMANPESETARKFRETVERYIQSKFQDREAEESIRRSLTAWRDNDGKLEPILQGSFLLREVAPLSQGLSMAGTTGLLALDYLDKSQTSPPEWRAQRLRELDAAKAPKAALLLTVTEPVRELVDLSAGPRPQ